MVETRQIDGRSVTFRQGVGRAPALVCIHGSADNHHVYDRLLDAMPDRERYAINLPGRAGTDGPALATVAEMEAFLSRFLESEVEGDYLVVGHSLGGGVAIEHALASPPDRLKGIVLLATGARLRVHPMILQLFEQAAKSGKTSASASLSLRAGRRPSHRRRGRENARTDASRQRWCRLARGRQLRPNRDREGRENAGADHRGNQRRANPAEVRSLPRRQHLRQRVACDRRRRPHAGDGAGGRSFRSN